MPKHRIKNSCCDCSFFKRNSFIPKRVPARTRSIAKFAINIMIKNYKKIIHQSKARDGKVVKSFKKNFLPEKYLDSYLKIADLMTDKSIENIINSVFAGGKIDGIKNQSRILFIHGTKGNEMLSKKAATLMKKYYPITEVVCFKGDAHCYKAIYEPEKWIDTVEKFLKDNSPLPNKKLSDLY